MPLWTLIVIWAFIALVVVVVIGASLEKRRGRRGAPDPEYTGVQAEAEMRMHNRGHHGQAGL